MKKHILYSSLIVAFLVCLASSVQAQHGHEKGKHKKVHTSGKGHKHGHSKHGHSHKKVNRGHSAHHHYSKLPKRGHVCNARPAASIYLSHRGVKYTFAKGVCYRPRTSGGFVVCAAPRGMRLRALPVGFVSIRIAARPNPYYYYYGTFYAESSSGGNVEYEVVAAPIGAKVNALPEGYKEVALAGKQYYFLDETYYQEGKGDDGEPYYEVVNMKG